MTGVSDTRSVIEAFADLFYGDLSVRAAFEAYVAPEYRQHNPLAGDGRDAAIAMLEGFAAATPGLSMDVKRILVDGDIAAVHLHLRMSPDDRGMAVVDLFRVKGGRIVEHWDVVQPVPAESGNDNSMF
ncbi:nuclear transport factor 2 family protein [Sphingomonas profundi]|uniref:nuclear transport factor 2 family protein n=1 Tax=Alterirhizorhabdus profundi TaxID=2681549 RepID=UPI0012E75DA0|nr:nuclear transport factor 2 family protein [Sphingomonas profundi]